MSASEDLKKDRKSRKQLRTKKDGVKNIGKNERKDAERTIESGRRGGKRRRRKKKEI